MLDAPTTMQAHTLPHALARPLAAAPAPRAETVRQVAVDPAAVGERLRVAFCAHYSAIWRLLRRLGVDAAQLDDAAQEVFAVLARRHLEVEAGREGAFLYGVALRIAAATNRSRHRLPTAAELEQLLQIADAKPSPEAELALKRDRLLLDVVLDQLPTDLRTVLVLAELEELELTAIAQLEQLPLGTVNSRLRRAREEFSVIAKRLRAQLASKGLSQ
jgi:RNA polymerase sigma-70 factor, ECF subfamily